MTAPSRTSHRLPVIGVPFSWSGTRVWTEVGRLAAPWAFPLVYGAVVLAALLAYSARVLTDDSFLDLTAGRLITSAGAVPHVSHLTVSAAGRPWVDQQWLADVVYYGVWSAAGPAAVGLLSACLVATAFVLTARIMQSRGVSVGRAAIWLTIAFFVCQPNTATRAQSFAYPLFVALLAIALRLEQRAAPDGWSWTAVPLLVLWANLHGSALMAAGLFAAYATLRAVVCLRFGRLGAAARFAGLGVASAASVFVCPYTPAQIAGYYQSIMSNPLLPRYVQEWQPSRITDIGNVVFYAALLAVLAAVALAVRARIRVSPVLVGLVAVTALGAVHAVRMQVWFALPAVVLAAVVFTALDGRGVHALAARRSRVMEAAGAGAFAVSAVLVALGDHHPRVLEWLVFVGVVLVCAAARQARPTRLVMASVALLLCVSLVGQARLSEAQMTATNSPALEAAVVRAATASPHALILADADTSNQLLFDHPELAGRVGFDASLEIVPPRRLQSYFAFWYAQGPNRLAATRGYDILATSAAYPALRRELAGLRGWTTIAADSKGIVLSRG